MGSNWKLITKFGCFYHFALQRSARECTKFLNACAVLLFCQLHLLFCHILVAVDVFGLHKLPNTNYFFKINLSTQCTIQALSLLKAKNLFQYSN